MNGTNRQRPRKLIVILRIATPRERREHGGGLDAVFTDEKKMSAAFEGAQFSAALKDSHERPRYARYPRRRRIQDTVYHRQPLKHYGLRRDVRLQRPDYASSYYYGGDSEDELQFEDEDEDDSEPEIEVSVKSEGEVEAGSAPTSPPDKKQSREPTDMSVDHHRSAKPTQQGGYGSDRRAFGALDASNNASDASRSKHNSRSPIASLLGGEAQVTHDHGRKYGLRSKEALRKPDYYCPDEWSEDAEDDYSDYSDEGEHLRGSVPVEKAELRKKHNVDATTAVHQSSRAENTTQQLRITSDGESQANPIVIGEEPNQSSFIQSQRDIGYNAQTRPPSTPLPHRHRPGEQILDTNPHFEAPEHHTPRKLASFSPTPKERQTSGRHANEPAHNEKAEHNPRKRKAPPDDNFQRQRSQRDDEDLPAAILEGSTVEAQELRLWHERLKFRAAVIEYQKRQAAE